MLNAVRTGGWPGLGLARHVPFPHRGTPARMTEIADSDFDPDRDMAFLDDLTDTTTHHNGPKGS